MHLPEPYGTPVGMISFDDDSVIPPKCSAKLSSFYASRLVTLRMLDSRGFRLKQIGHLSVSKRKRNSLWPELALSGGKVRGWTTTQAGLVTAASFRI